MKTPQEIDEIKRGIEDGTYPTDEQEEIAASEAAADAELEDALNEMPEPAWHDD